MSGMKTPQTCFISKQDFSKKKKGFFSVVLPPRSTLDFRWLTAYFVSRKALPRFQRAFLLRVNGIKNIIFHAVAYRRERNQAQRTFRNYFGEKVSIDIS